MTFLNETTSRADLEIAAIFQCNFDLKAIEAATDAQLLEMIAKWIEEGDECKAA
jgi:hypothetical protein